MTDYQVNPLSDAMGVELVGLDLQDGLDAGTAAQLDALLARHLVLVIRDQDLQPAQMLTALSKLGPPMRQHYSKMLAPACPDIGILSSADSPRDANGVPQALGSTCFHSDHINHEKPPKCTILHAKKLPASGGDTSFANMRSAYKRLPAARRAQVERLRSVNGLDHGSLIAEQVDRQKHSARAVQPLVRTHPVTGEHALYFHPTKLDHFEGMSRDASLEFLQQLQDEVLTPEVIYRHQWRVGDLLITDNRACVHKAHDDYDHNDHRIMYRLLIQGDQPYFRPVTRPTYA